MRSRWGLFQSCRSAAPGPGHDRPRLISSWLQQR